MEEKKITEKESLELISQMIEQTKKESAIGSGDTFLIWGYLCVLCSLSVAAMTYFVGSGMWGWLYFAIPILGLIITGFNATRQKKNHKSLSTYSTSSIDSIWVCISGVFIAYTVWCFMDWSKSAGWSGMFLLGLLLPGIGTHCTGVIQKEKVLQLCGMLGILDGLGFLHDLCCEGAHITIEWHITLAVSLFITLVIPGHYLNHKSKNKIHRHARTGSITS